MYVCTKDLDPQGRLNDGVPIEPLILRANAGDCIEVNLTNGLDYSADVFQNKQLTYAQPLGTLPDSTLGRSQGDDRIDPRRAAGGNPTGDECDCERDQ